MAKKPRMTASEHKAKRVAKNHETAIHRMEVKKARRDKLKALRAPTDKAREALAVEEIKKADDELYRESLKIVRNTLEFQNMDIDSEGRLIPGTEPEEWNRLTEAERKKKIRLATIGWMRSNDVPHGVKMAHLLLLGIVKGRSQQTNVTQVVNIQPAVLPVPSAIPAEFEVIDED